MIETKKKKEEEKSETYYKKRWWILFKYFGSRASRPDLEPSNSISPALPTLFSTQSNPQIRPKDYGEVRRVKPPDSYHHHPMKVFEAKVWDDRSEQAYEHERVEQEIDWEMSNEEVGWDERVRSVERWAAEEGMEDLNEQDEGVLER